MDTIGADLRINIEDVIPLCLSRHTATYKVDALWARIIETLPDSEKARRIRLQRLVIDERTRWDWQRALSQAYKAGRLVARTVKQSLTSSTN